MAVCSVIAAIVSWGVARSVGQWPNLEVPFGVLGWLCALLFVAAVVLAVYVALRVREPESQHADLSCKG
ncbi:MAG TPA: hypothetical protein VG433_16795 [Pirellulales bacterium]|nr:hypothetical protein [Pirellulales bacterium]